MITTPDNKPSSLENEFAQELIQKSEQAKKDCKYNPARFLQMIAKNGGVKTAKLLIAKDQISDGFETLKMCDRLDLSMEAVVVDQKYADLFTDDEVDICFMRLCECEFYK